MNGKAKNKVTSGRLTGAGKMGRPMPSVVPAARPDPAYSLYSTDSEDQVSSIQRGLDHCAALLNGILQADNADLSTLKPGATKSKSSSTSLGKKGMRKLPFKTASPGLSRTMKGGAAKSRPLTSERKTTIKKVPTKAALATNQQSCPPGLHEPSRSAPRSSRPPLQRLNMKSPHLPDPNPPPQQLPASPSGPTERRCVSEHTHEDLLPVRDTNIQSCAETSPAVSRTPRTSRLQLGTGQEQSWNTQEQTRTVQDLLGELRTRLSGEGSRAETLLSQLEQELNVGGSNIQTDGATDASSLQVHQEEKTLFNAQELQEELITAQSRLQDVQNDLAALRKALQDTQNQLRNTEAENSLMKKDLERTRSRLLESEREKSELASLSQSRLEEMGNLKRFIQTWCSSGRHDVDEKSAAEHFSQQDPAGPSADRISRYLKSLSDVEPAECVNTTAPQQSLHPRPPGLDDSRRCWRPSGCSSQCDAESVWSYWSAKSGSTFDTRDEAAFRDGLAALDASIATLQKTIQLDLKR